MNRADLSLVLNQVDNVGDTLLRNRMNAEAKQERAADRNLREKMFTEQQATRKELQTQNNAWKTQNEDQQQLQMIIKANADGSLDDASRERANQWILSHPQLSATGIQLTKPMPKAVGTMETSQTRNHAELKKLQEQIRMATTPEEKAAAEQDLADFKSLLPGRPEVVKPEISQSDKELEILQRKRLDAEAVADENAITKIDTAISKRSPKGAGALRKRDEQLMNEAAAGQPEPQSLDAELKLAQDAIRQGANRAKVADKFKARTGQDLPQ